MSNLNLTDLPSRMRPLPRDHRGYPVPWFVDWIDGVPEFRAMDLRKFARALREKLCWVCGEKLGVHLCFVAGPMCGINRISAEPPSHWECARWSAINCPFLNNPKMVRREDELMNVADCRERAPGVAIARNPGVTMLWTTRSFETFKTDPKKQPLIIMGEPEAVDWFHRGRLATRDEVVESIDSGMPILAAAAREDGVEAQTELRRQRARLERWLPGERVGAER